MTNTSEVKTNMAPPGTGRGGEQKVSPRGGDVTAPMGSARASARGEGSSTARDINASGPEIETFRSTMDTARVHTALAALSAERQALMSKLAYIDSALEAEGKKKTSLIGKKK